MANTSVFGIYSTQEQAAEAMDRMKADGFRNADISVLCPDGAGSKDLGMRKHGKALQGAAKGGAIGIVVGGVLGWLAGSGLMAMPMFEAMAAAGPILAALSGAGVGAIIGGMIGAMIGLGVPEYEAKRFQGRTRSGGILLSLHSDDAAWTKKARAALAQTGAVDIAAVTESKGDYGNSDRPAARRVG
ncbi:MAG TPA: DUF3341 domain-containing protein [Terriglobales bacterium]|jgi:hypothetical protein